MNEAIINALASEIGGEEVEPQYPKWHHGLTLDMSWRPKLNPKQELVYDSKAPYILSYGERGTGKTTGAIHKLVNHCVRNKNALGVIITREMGMQSEGGAFSKLILEVLPQWKFGNYDRKTGKRLDNGCGIDYTPVKLDNQDKKPFVMITNSSGGHSMIKCLSLYVDHAVGGKIKGKEFSFCLVDEAQTMETAEAYFSEISMQVGRRQDIDDVQQLIYCANPKGRSHWLYQTFFYHGKDDEGNPIECPIDEDTGHPVDPVTDKPIKDYCIVHVPIAENAQHLPAGYWDRVLNAVKNDPIEHARMVEGLWVDKPEGDALFKEVWNDAIHLRGDALKNRGLMPIPGHMFILGWDPGAAHTSISMMQFIPTPKKLYWTLFDEMNFVGKYMPYRRLVPKVIDRLIYWEYAVNEAMVEELGADSKRKPVEFQFRHISDDSAFNQFRAKEGSFDAQDIEDISRAYVAENKLPERFIIKMRACPKGPHSIEARVRIATDLLVEESLIVSATCVQTREMFMGVESDRENRMKPKRSKHLHPFDSMSYPLLYYGSGYGKSATKIQVTTLKPEFFRI